LLFDNYDIIDNYDDCNNCNIISIINLKKLLMRIKIQKSLFFSNFHYSKYILNIKLNKLDKQLKFYFYAILKF